MTETIDQIKARFQPKTRGGYEYEIFAEREGRLWGRTLIDSVWFPRTWCVKSGQYVDDCKSDYDLLPRSPHDELIREARKYIEYAPNCAPLVARLIEALEEKCK